MGRTQLLGTELVFASLHEARDRIGNSDEYTQQLSDYELQAKTQRVGNLVEGDYLENARRFARSWTSDEVEYLRTMAQATEDRLQDLSIDLPLPREIWLIKTTGGEEGGANGYTRTNNIFLNESSLSLNLFRHELFHITTRHDHELRDKCYATLGFERVGPIAYADPNRISNPDALGVEHCLNVRHRGKTRRVTIVLTGSRAYSGGSFFSYVAKRLLPADDLDDPLLDFGQVAGLYDQIGRNTSYNIHQEEICASHFELMLSGRIGLPHQDLIDHLRATMGSLEQESAK